MIPTLTRPLSARISNSSPFHRPGSLDSVRISRLPMKYFQVEFCSLWIETRLESVWESLADPFLAHIVIAPRKLEGSHTLIEPLWASTFKRKGGWGVVSGPNLRYNRRLIPSAGDVVYLRTHQFILYGAITGDDSQVCAFLQFGTIDKRLWSAEECNIHIDRPVFCFQPQVVPIIFGLAIWQWWQESWWDV